MEGLTKLGQTENSRLFIDQENEFTLHVYIKNMELAETKEAAMMNVHAFQEHGVKATLIDLTDVTLFHMPTQRWIGAEWFPAAISAGLKYIAFVWPSDKGFGRFGLKNCNDRMEKEMKEANGGVMPEIPVDRQYFDTREEAAEWLRSQLVTKS